MKDRYHRQYCTVLFFSLFLLMSCGGGGNGFVLGTEKTGDGKIKTANPEGSIALRLHPRNFGRERDWVEKTCDVYQDEDLPLPEERLNKNFLLEENYAWNCVRLTKSFQIDTEIRFYDNGTYDNNLTSWQVIIADTSVALPPGQEGCHIRGMPYNSTWETEEPEFAFDRRGQWRGEWRVSGGRLYLKEEDLPGRLKSYTFSFEGEKILRLNDMVETYSDGSAVNYQEDLEPSELDSEEARLWKSELRDEETFCRITRRDID